MLLSIEAPPPLSSSQPHFLSIASTPPHCRCILCFYGWCAGAIDVGLCLCSSGCMLLVCALSSVMCSGTYRGGGDAMTAMYVSRAAYTPASRLSTYGCLGISEDFSRTSHTCCIPRSFYTHVCRLLVGLLSCLYRLVVNVLSLVTSLRLAEKLQKKEQHVFFFFRSKEDHFFSFFRFF